MSSNHKLNSELIQSAANRTTDKIKTAYILGAGFSHNAGMPIQKDFLNKILHCKGSDRVLAESLKEYVRLTYGAKPTLEDVFTFIDMSANTGHHLGKDFYPARLRSLRRILITRILQVLIAEYRKTNVMKDFITAIDMKRSAFISLNWDTVLEKKCCEFMETNILQTMA